MTKFKRPHHKVFLGLLICVGLVGAHQGFTRLQTELDTKETSLDSNSEDDAGIYPLLGFYLEAEDKEGVPEKLVNKVALESCRAEVDDVRDFTPLTPSEYKKHSCVENNHSLYEIGRLKIHGCDWTEQDSKKLAVDLLKHFESEFTLENLKFFFRDDEMLCSADVVSSRNEKFSVTGNCAIASMEPFKTINGKKPENRADPMFVVFQFDQEDNLIKKEILPIKKLGPNTTLLLSVAIPVKKSASDYLAYMLSNESIEACDQLKK